MIHDTLHRDVGVNAKVFDYNEGSQIVSYLADV